MHLNSHITKALFIIFFFISSVLAEEQKINTKKNIANDSVELKKYLSTFKKEISEVDLYIMGFDIERNGYKDYAPIPLYKLKNSRKKSLSNNRKPMIILDEFGRITVLSTNINTQQEVDTINSFIGLKSLSFNKKSIFQGHISLNKLEHLNDFVSFQTRIKSILFSKNNNLSSLTLLSTPIKEINFKNLANLEYLHISNSNLNDLSDLIVSSKLEYLNLIQDDSISIIPPLSNFKLLELLRIGQSINNVRGMNELSSLKILTTPKNFELRDQKLPISLEELTISFSDRSVFPDLSHHLKLKKLKITNTKVKAVTGICNMESLETLDLSKNEIDDISGLKNLPNLKDLKMDYNNLTSIDNLYDFPNLESATFEDNKITKFNGIKGSNKLLGISLLYNPLEYVNLDAIKDRGIFDLSIEDTPVHQSMNKEDKKKLFNLRIYGQFEKPEGKQ